MKAKKKLVKVLTGVAVAILLLSGGVALAYTVIWSGTASITIVEPSPPAGGGGGGTTPPEPEPLYITYLHSAGKGTYEDGVWTITLPQGDSASLYMMVNNPRNTDAVVEMLVNGESQEGIPQTELPRIVPGVFIDVSWPLPLTIPANDHVGVSFYVDVSDNATLGVIPDVLLEIKEIVTE